MNFPARTHTFLSAYLCLLILICFFPCGLSASLIYSNNFSATNSEWSNGFPYGRNGILFPANSSYIAASNGRLVMRGACNVNATPYNSFWVGKNARLESNFSASPTQPFGFTVLRYMAWVDPFNGTSEMNYWQFSGATAWIVKESGISAEWALYPAFVMMFEDEQMGGPTNVPAVTNRSKWGAFAGSPFNFDLGQAKRADGTTINLTNSSIYSLEWLHKVGVSPYMIGGGTNTNAVAIKMTHDGYTVNFFINPNPLGVNAYPNEFCWVGNQSVFFSNNMRVMLGQEANMSYTRAQAIDYDDFLIRSAVDGLSYQLSPEMQMPGPARTLTIELKPKMIASDAGIGEVFLTFASNASFDMNGLEVVGEWGDGKNDGKASAFRLTTSRPSLGVAAVHNSSSTIAIEFCKLSEKEHNVIRPDTKEPRLWIKLPMRVSNLTRSETLITSVAIDLTLHDGDHIPWQSTTGVQQGNYEPSDAKPRLPVMEARK